MSPGPSGAGSDRPPGGDGPLDVVVTLGTDHHPFARLVGWVDAWAEAHPDRTCVVQHGTARAPRHAEGHRVLDPAVIPDLMGRARIVVGHAGPGTVLDARAAGRLPVIVPRLAALGEVVDDHQVTFGHWMDTRNQAVCVEDEASLHRRIDAAVSDPAAFTIDRGDGAPAPAITLLGDLLNGILTR